jgi:hypothetical protein
LWHIQQSTLATLGLEMREALQVQFVAARSIDFVDPADDPRKKQSQPGVCIEVPSPKKVLSIADEMIE